jgi:hypothetical protein
LFFLKFTGDGAEGPPFGRRQKNHRCTFEQVRHNYNREHTTQESAFKDNRNAKKVEKRKIKPANNRSNSVFSIIS